MPERVPMTAEGKKLLAAELTRLKTVARPQNIRAIEEARAHGDISENAEYAAAKEQQSQIEGRIIELEDKLSRSEVINPQTGIPSKVVFGVAVTVMDVESEKEATYRIVGEYESAPEKNLISITSPVARALISKAVGDEVAVPAPGGTRTYEILSIKP